MSLLLFTRRAPVAGRAEWRDPPVARRPGSRLPHARTSLRRSAASGRPSLHLPVVLPSRPRDRAARRIA